MHATINPAILYWGTPVAIVSTENEDGTFNLAPTTSVFWLGHRCVLGLAAESKTPQNILRTGQCVVNLPDDTQTGAVNGLAKTTGTEVVPPGKISRGYSFVHDKWAASGLTPQASQAIRPPRARECPVQMECELAMAHEMWKDLPEMAGVILIIELRVLRVHVEDGLRMKGYENRVDPDKWRPLIMSFQEFYGLDGGKKGPSRLGEIGEEEYRMLADADAKHPVEEVDIIASQELV
ncbi:unnamed protein product [Clonostachys byssicola]|uniref:Flavin reductase like domain-containing protein n=1 Tax=Clonostachys byssicola TaxID=160290 RepID=A0A9N9Y2E9_9HYPO|nr:unnamed protein product [Clonostachys byssicola]